MPSGFLAGYLAMQQGQQQTAESKVRTALDEALLQEHGLELQEMQRKQQSAQQMRQFASTLPADKPLSDKFDALANMMAEVDPDKALDFADKAIGQKDKEFKLAQERRKQLQDQLEAGADIASGVQNQEAADGLFDWANKSGVKLPTWLPKEYNQQTAPAFQRFGKMFMSAKDRETLLRTAESIKYQQAREDLMQRQADQRDRRLDQQDRDLSRKEARDQAQWEQFWAKEDRQREKQRKALDRPATFTELTSLAQEAAAVAESKGIEMPSKYGDEHMTIARDIYKEKNSLLKQDEDLDPKDAEDTAIHTVLARVQDGKYIPPEPKAKAKPTAAAGPKGTKDDPVPVTTPEEVTKLPAGTYIRLPNGELRIAGRR